MLLRNWPYVKSEKIDSMSFSFLKMKVKISTFFGMATKMLKQKQAGKLRRRARRRFLQPKLRYWLVLPSPDFGLIVHAGREPKSGA